MKGWQKSDALAHLCKFERVRHLLLFTQLLALEVVHLLDFLVFFFFGDEA